MKDRIPLYPGRVKLTAVDGQPGVYDMVRADEATEQGTPLSKATLLDDDTAESYGLDKDTAVPNDAFKLINGLLVGANRYVTVKVQTEAGVPVPDVTLSGITTVSGGVAKTDANGEAFGVASGEQTTISVASPYTDITIPSKTIATPAGKFTKVTLTGTLVDFVAITTSSKVRLSALVTRVDVSLVGGGNGGNNGVTKNTSTAVNSGAGGDGGKVAVIENVSFAANVEYAAQIGAGGAAKGGTGGDTSIFGQTSANGQQAKGGNAKTSNGYGVAGTNGYPVYTSFTQTEDFGASGGSGAFWGNETSGYGTGGEGGEIGGGIGGDVYSAFYPQQTGAYSGEAGLDGKGGGGGGGGVLAGYYGDSSDSGIERIGYGGAGGSGYIGMRIYH